MDILHVTKGIAEDVAKELERADDNWDALSERIIEGFMVDPTFRKMLKL